MKVSKKIYGVLCVMALLFLGCESTKHEGTPSVSIKRTDILDSKGMAIGADIPQWLQGAIEGDYSALEKEYKDCVVYFAEGVGKNLDGVKSWVQNFQVSGNFSRALSNTVIAKFGGNLEGDKESEDIDTFLKDMVASFSQSAFHGLELKKDYWIKVRVYKDKRGSAFEDSYRYYIVYAIDKNVLKEQLEVALGKVEAKNTAQQKMKEETISFMDEVQALAQSN